ncbi:S26 family signal peptidase [Streptomyces cathayae]|uniref:S26 family signal peptidase n=1 Tax=Streptomyces cathayae TaxID=3031124 RepID=A0ABY8JWP9_9ACTN|nr:S26 family signal peptidase [Streptomyces sp. HUAS 5]WGD38995.1 S26 family signal peptidase [Streptomyces sp. HUAS 5]
MDYALYAVSAVVAALLAVSVGRVARRRLGFVTKVESESMAPTLAPGRRLPPPGAPVSPGRSGAVTSWSSARPSWTGWSSSG